MGKIDRASGAAEPQFLLPSSEAMASFIRAERPALLAFFRRRLGHEDAAEEASQDSFIRLLRYQDSKPGFVWRFLLYRIAAYVATDHVRRAKSHHAAHHTPLDQVSLTSSAPSPESIVSGAQDLELLRRAILDLPPKCKQVFLLNRMQGMSYAQIATHCGISIKMVEKHIHNAVTLCRARVDRGH